VNSLVDTGAQGFLFLNSTIARSLSESLQVPIQRLPFKILVKGFQDQIQTPVDRCIRLHMRIDGRTIRNCPFVIMDLGSQDCIIGVKWLRQFRLHLDTYRNRLLWPTEYPATYDAAPPLLMTLAQPKYNQNVELDIARRDALWEQDEARRNYSPSVNRIRGFLKIPKPRNIASCHSQSVDLPDPIRTMVHPHIAIISANGLHFNMKQKENEFFTTTLYEIDRILENKRSLEDDPDNVDLLRDRLPPVYQEYRDVFSKAAADQLPKHRFYDHKIVLTESLPNAYSALYKQSIEELEATKKYLQDNLEKGFIEHSRSPFASLSSVFVKQMVTLESV
jgi:predicted aspartyl protease